MEPKFKIHIQNGYPYPKNKKKPYLNLCLAIFWTKYLNLYLDLIGLKNEYPNPSQFRCRYRYGQSLSDPFLALQMT